MTPSPQTSKSLNTTNEFCAANRRGGGGTLKRASQNSVVEATCPPGTTSSPQGTTRPRARRALRKRHNTPQDNTPPGPTFKARSPRSYVSVSPQRSDSRPEPHNFGYTALPASEIFPTPPFSGLALFGTVNSSGLSLFSLQAYSGSSRRYLSNAALIGTGSLVAAGVFEELRKSVQGVCHLVSFFTTAYRYVAHSRTLQLDGFFPSFSAPKVGNAAARSKIECAGERGPQGAGPRKISNTNVSMLWWDTLE